MEPTERDLLIRVDQKVTDLCGQFEKVVAKVDTKLSVSTFRWFIGVVIALIAAMGSINFFR